MQRIIVQFDECSAILILVIFGRLESSNPIHPITAFPSSVCISITSTLNFGRTYCKTLSMVELESVSFVLRIFVFLETAAIAARLHCKPKNQDSQYLRHDLLQCDHKCNSYLLLILSTCLLSVRCRIQPARARSVRKRTQPTAQAWSFAACLLERGVPFVELRCG